MKYTYHAARAFILRICFAILATLVVGVDHLFGKGELRMSNVNSVWFESIGTHKRTGAPIYVTAGITKPTIAGGNWGLIYALSSGALILGTQAAKPYCVLNQDEIPSVSVANTLPDPLVATVAPILLRGSDETILMRAAGAITQGQFVYTAANGQVQNAATGACWRVGVALTTSTTAGDWIEVAQCVPQAATDPTAG